MAYESRKHDESLLDRCKNRRALALRKTRKLFRARARARREIAGSDVDAHVVQPTSTAANITQLPFWVSPSLDSLDSRELLHV